MIVILEEHSAFELDGANRPAACGPRTCPSCTPNDISRFHEEHDISQFLPLASVGFMGHFRATRRYGNHYTHRARLARLIIAGHSYHMLSVDLLSRIFSCCPSGVVDPFDAGRRSCWTPRPGEGPLPCSADGDVSASSKLHRSSTEDDGGKGQPYRMCRRRA